MKIYAAAFTERGFGLGERIKKSMPDIELCRIESGELGKWTEAAFSKDTAIIFIGAAGIAVRAIAPFVKSKTSDPAVIVMDEAGRFVIPVLSGHLGGANELALRLSAVCGAQAVITTATDVNGKFAVDVWAKSNNLKVIDPGRIKSVSSRVLAGKTVFLKSLYPISGDPPEHVALTEGAADITVSHLLSSDASLRLVPCAVWAGIGARKGIELERIEKAYGAALLKSGIEPAAVAGVATIDIKKDEQALNAFCKKRELRLLCFSAEELGAVEGDFSRSEFVKSVTGVDNVCERAAAAACGGRLIAKKFALDGVTVAFALKEPHIAF